MPLSCETSLVTENEDFSPKSAKETDVLELG
jgi:hypothetical protein